MAAIAKLRFKDFIEPGEACHFAVTRAHWSTVAVHTHDFCEIFWIEAGRGLHVINGERRPIAKGVMMFVLPDDHHGFVSDVTEHALLIANLAFPTTVWRALRQAYFSERVDLSKSRAIGQREFRLSTWAWGSLLDASAEVRDGARSNVALTRLLLNIEYLSHAKFAALENVPKWLAHACREIRRPQHFRGGTKAFCQLAGRSPEHVARDVRRFLRKTPTVLVNEARMQWATDQLAETDRSILNIAMDCGLDNLGHFYKLFQAARGTSPHRFRLAQQRILRPIAGGSDHRMPTSK